MNPKSQDNDVGDFARGIDFLVLSIPPLDDDDDVDDDSFGDPPFLRYSKDVDKSYRRFRF